MRDCFWYYIERGISSNKMKEESKSIVYDLCYYPVRTSRSISIRSNE